MKKNYLILLTILLLLPLVSAYSNSTGLVSEWSLEGNATDTYGRNNAVVNGTDNAVGCVVGNCMYWNNATNDNLIVYNPQGLDNVAEMTINLWLNQTDRNYLTRLFHMNLVYSVTSNNGGLNADEIKPRVYNASTSVELDPVAGNDVTYGVWEMFTVTYKSGNLSLYYDGELVVSSASLTGSVKDDSVPLFIGIDENGDSNEYLGQMDEITFWNRSLTASEVSTLYTDYLSDIRPSDVEPEEPEVIVYGNALYFNATSGNDSANCSITHPCKTLGFLQNNITLNASNDVYFACGETWREPYLMNDVSGTSGNHVTFNSYGYCNSSNKPKFYGSWNNITWNNVGGNMWESVQTFPDTIYAFWYDTNTNVSKYTNRELTYSNVNTNWEMYYNSTSDKIRVYLSTGNPATVGNGVEVPFFNSTHTANWVNEQRDYLEFNGLEFGYCRNYCFYSHLGSNIVFNNTNFMYSYSKGLYLNGAESSHERNILIDNAKLYSVGVEGVDNGGTNGGGEALWIAATDNVIVNNSILYLSHGVPINYWHTSGGGVHNTVIYDCDTDRTDWGSGIYYDGCSNSYNYNNTVKNCVIGFSVNSEIAYNYSRNNTFHKSISIDNMMDANIGCEWTNNCIYDTNYTGNDFIRTNYSALSGMNGQFLLKNFTNLSFYNNIIQYTDDDTRNMYYYLMNSSSSSLGFRSDYNLFYSNNAINNYSINNVRYYSFPTYKAGTGLDTNSLLSDPLLDSNYVPLGSSLVCGAASDGSDIGALPCGYWDDVPPGIVANSPINTTSGTSPTLFNCSASDNDELFSVNLYLNGVLNQTTYNSSNSTIVTWDINLPDGYYDWYCSAVDTSGNTNSTPVNYVLVDIVEYNLTLVTHEKITNNTLNDVTHYFGYSYAETKNKGFPYFNSSVNNTLVVLNSTVVPEGVFVLGLTTYFANQSYVENMTATVKSSSTLCWSYPNIKMTFHYNDGTSQDTAIIYGLGCGSVYTNYTFDNPYKNKVVVRAETYLNRGYINVDVLQNYQRASYYDYFNSYNESNLLESTTYEVKSIKEGYYDLYNNITIALSNETIHLYNMYNSTLNIYPINIYTNATVNDFSGYLYNASYNESFTSSTGLASLNILSGETYSIVVDSSNFALYYGSVALVNTSQNLTVYLYSNNSIYIQVRDESTGNYLPNGTSITLNEDSTESYVINQTYLFTNLTSGVYNVVVSQTGYQTRIYEISLEERSSRNLTAYLLNSSYASNYVVFTVLNANTGGQVSNASVVMSRMISGIYVPVESKYSDISGQVQFNFQPLTKYQFTATATGYADQVFYLNPIIFTSYNIRMNPETVSIIPGEEITDITVVYGSTTFYKDTPNNFTFSISSGSGSLEEYTINVSYPGGSQIFNGVNALGETFTAPIDMSGIVLSEFDTVNVSYCYSSSLGDDHCYSYTYDIIGYSSAGSWQESRGNTFGLGLIERLLIVTLAVIIVAGFFTIFIGPIAGGVLGLFLFGFFVATGFVELWAILPSVLVGFFILSKRGGM